MTSTIAKRACVLLPLLLIACGKGQPGTKSENPQHNSVGQGQIPIPAASPGMELQQVDYAEARKTFRTQLTRRGPSPQQFERLRAPVGAVAMPYQSGDLRLTAIVGPTANNGVKKPAVVFLHGGFAYGDSPGDSDWEMSKPYRDAGFVVMTPVLRGENGQPGNFTLYYDEVNDVLAATEAFAKLPNVDGTRIYIAGHSAGATLSILTVMTSKRFRAAASLSGMMDQSYLRQERSALVCFDISNDREIQMRSPVAYATSFKCPARLYFGNVEQLHQPNNQRTAVLARRIGLNVEVSVVPGDHSSSVPESIRRSIEFFKQ